jgi:hypothetical protein
VGIDWVGVLVQDLGTGALASGDRVSFGRGGDVAVDLRLSDHPAMSRCAGWVDAVESGLRITCTQALRAGYLDVHLPGGHSVARLTHGATFGCVNRVVVVVLRVLGGPTCELRVERDGVAPDVVAPLSSSTVVPWSRVSILDPARGEEWPTVVAIAAARALYGNPEAAAGPPEPSWSGAVPTKDWLLQACGKWFGTRPSEHWVTNRLDRALSALGMAIDGTDKLARLVPAVLTGELIDRTTLRMVHERLE